MRLVGIVLVVVGALALGVQGFNHLGRGRPESAAESARADAAGDKLGWASPVVGGIAVVGGLLLLASDGRRE